MRPTLDLRLLPLAGGTWAATWLTLRISPWPVIAVIALLIGWWARPLRGAHATRASWVLTVIAGLLAGMVATGANAAGRSNHIAAAAADKRYVTITATVRSDAMVVRSQYEAKAPRYYLWLDARQVCVREHCEPTRETVLAIGQLQSYRAGMRIETSGVVKPTARGDEASAFQQVTASRLLATPHAIGQLTDTIRQSFRKLTAELPAHAAGLLPGITLGDRSQIQPRLAEDFNTASLTHLTAVSGAHTAVILAAVLTLTLSLPRLISAALALITLAGLYLLVGPLPSVTRAVVMATIIVLARACGRSGQGVAALAAAIVVILLVWPHAAVSIGFALSVSAAGALMLFVPLTTRVFARLLPRWLAAAIAVPLIAQLAVTPLLMRLSGSVQVWSVIANLLATPAFVPALLLAFPAALLSPIAPSVALGLAKLASIGTWWMAAVATRIAALPGANLRVVNLPAAPYLFAALSIVIIAALWYLDTRLGASHPLRSRRQWRSRVRMRLQQRPKASGISRRRLIAVGVVGALLVAATWWWTRPAAPPWQIWQCDIGQGSALLARTGAQSAVMVDVGNLDAGGDRCVQDAGITTLDAIMLSHPHADHVRGLDAVLQVASAGAIYLGPASHPANNYAEVLDVAKRHDVPVVSPIATGTTSGTFGDANWEIWWPPPKVASAWNTDAGANDLSLVVAFNTGGLRTVVLADVEIPAQEGLLRQLETSCGVAAQKRCANVDVVVMAHHGSKAQVKALAEYFAAPTVLVSVGPNEYGHPTQSAIEMYEDAGGQIFRTDELGHLALRREGDRVIITAR